MDIRRFFKSAQAPGRPSAAPAARCAASLCASTRPSTDDQPPAAVDTSAGQSAQDRSCAAAAVDGDTLLRGYRQRPRSSEHDAKRARTACWANQARQLEQPAASRRRHKFDLTDEQRAAVELVASGRSVFLTGGAGTGKSHTLSAIVSKMRDLHGAKSVFVTASTGLAASAVGGTTVHFFAGVGMGKGTPAQLLAIARRNQDAAGRWLRARVLIVDEVSMIDGQLFDSLDFVARNIRDNDKPMGGLQLVLCGDFLQLPPVNADKFAFESAAWKRLEPVTVLLKRAMRQSTDESFAAVLDQVRRGCVTPAVSSALSARVHASLATSSEGVEATSLFPRRSEAEERNRVRLDALEGEAFEFAATDTGEEPFVTQMRSNCPAATLLRLKVGAQVVLLRNIDRTQSLVNGATGVILRFEETEGEARPYVRFNSGAETLIEKETWETEVGGRIVATRVQLPLLLAWALTVHKAQGMSLDLVETTLDSVFEYGQAYVALSRARTLAGVRLLSYRDKSIRAHPRVTKFYEALDRAEIERPLTPIVKSEHTSSVQETTQDSGVTQASKLEWSSLDAFQQAMAAIIERNPPPTSTASQEPRRAKQQRTPASDPRKAVPSSLSPSAQALRAKGFRVVNLSRSFFAGRTEPFVPSGELKEPPTTSKDAV